MRPSIRIEGTDAIVRNLRAMGKALPADVLVPIISEELGPMADDMRAHAARASGQLADSVTVGTQLSPAQAEAVVPIAEVEVYAGPGPLPQAISEEFGNFRQDARPFIRPAFDGNVDKAMKNVATRGVDAILAKGMEDALNSLAALAQKLFSAIGGGGSGKGFFSAIGAALGLAGKSGSGSSAAAKLPGFRDGGSFRVAGRSGIDANLVAFRATRGEMVDIRHGNDNGPAGAPAVVELRVGAGEVFEARVAAVSGDVQVKTARSTNERAAMAARQNLNG